MINGFKILIVFLFLALNFYANAQNEISQKQATVFIDRDYCISGDTVWFKVWLPEQDDKFGNIVRVQFDSNGKNLISSVAKKVKHGWAEGFFYVPDSLSTGLCFVTAFLNEQRNEPDLKVKSKSLFVYNRFDEGVNELKIPVAKNRIEIEDYNNFIQISTNKNEYRNREQVAFNIELSEHFDMENAIVKATLIDPLSSNFGGNFVKELKSSNVSIPVFAEKDGFLLSGSVTDAEGNPQKGVLVVISIPNDPPFFDYYLTGNRGDFHFFLQNATGKTKVFIQTVEESGKEYLIHLKENYLEEKVEFETEANILTNEQSTFIASTINSSFIRRLFYPVLNIQQPYFSMPVKFEMPFYGPPTSRVLPDDFIDLPDFREISRELLHGVQYRIKNKEISFRLLNEKQGMFFDNEPLRLLNGIPVFKNSLLANLKSTDIKYVDIILNERLFGDLKFKGVLAIQLKDNSNAWTARQANVSQFQIDCLQPDFFKRNLEPKTRDVNQPELRQVYLWEIFQPKSEQEYRFLLSDIKGKVEISVEGITKQNKIFKASKIIDVK